MGLSKVLEMTLASLSDENDLISWSVFQEKSGQISVRIRFEAANDAVNHSADAYYHRKTPSQVKRDRERTEAWRAKTRKEPQLTQTDISAPTPPGDVPAQHAGILTRSKAKIVQLDTPEIQRGESTPASPEIHADLTLESLANDDGDVTPLLSQDTVISDIETDDKSTCLSSDEEIDDKVDNPSDHALSDDDAGIPDDQPPWWNKMMEDMSAEIRDMSAKLCVTPKPD